MKRAVLALALLLGGSRAQASIDPPEPACVIREKLSFSNTIYSHAQKGVELAHLEYGKWSVELLELPPDSSTGRARMRARRDGPSLRVDAWVTASTFLYYAQRDLPIIVDHVAIVQSANLRLFHPTASVLEAEPLSPTFEKTRAAIACADVGLVAPKPSIKPAAPTSSVAAREVALKNPSTPLFDGPTGKVIFTLVPLNKARAYVDAFEKVSGLEHVRYEGEVRIDGWIRSSDLWVPPEEGMNGLGGLGLSGTGSGYGSSAAKWSAKVDTEVRLGTEASAPIVGVLEKGARVWITKGPDWSEIRMVDGAATPPKGKQFFVRTVDLEP